MIVVVLVAIAERGIPFKAKKGDWIYFIVLYTLVYILSVTLDFM
jgi:hypothetical protein